MAKSSAAPATPTIQSAAEFLEEFKKSRPQRWQKYIAEDVLTARPQWITDFAEAYAQKRVTPAHQALYEALSALPLDSFGDDMSKHDAAEFVDHAGEFFEAMVKARAALALADAAQEK